MTKYQSKNDNIEKFVSRSEVRMAAPFETFDKFINNPWLRQFYLPPERRKELKQATEAAFTLDHPLKEKAIEKILALSEEEVLQEAYRAVDQERRRRFHSGLNLIPIDSPEKQISVRNLLALIEKLEASHPSWKRILEWARSIRPEDYEQYSAAGQILVGSKILELKEALASFRSEVRDRIDARTQIKAASNKKIIFVDGAADYNRSKARARAKELAGLMTKDGTRKLGLSKLV